MKRLIKSKLSLAHITTPFDLHVLSTPPAFILSQDQTLVKSFIPLRRTSDLFNKPCVSWNLHLLKFASFHRNERNISNESSRLFHYSVFKVQCVDKWNNHSDSLIRITHASAVVNTFFEHFQFNGERGIWTLAPVTRPTPLAGAPLQPLEYFSKLKTLSIMQFFHNQAHLKIQVAHCLIYQI